MLLADRAAVAAAPFLPAPEPYSAAPPAVPGESVRILRTCACMAFDPVYRVAWVSPGKIKEENRKETRIGRGQGKPQISQTPRTHMAI